LYIPLFLSHFLWFSPPPPLSVSTSCFDSLLIHMDTNTRHISCPSLSCPSVLSVLLPSVLSVLLYPVLSVLLSLSGDAWSSCLTDCLPDSRLAASRQGQARYCSPQ